MRVEVATNEPPRHGNVTITPSEGEAQSTPFSVVLEGFEDTDQPGA